MIGCHVKGRESALALQQDQAWHSVCTAVVFEHMYSQDEGFSPGVNVGLEGRGEVLVQVQRDCWRCFQFEGQCTTLLMRESQTLQFQRWGT